MFNELLIKNISTMARKIQSAPPGSVIILDYDEVLYTPQGGEDDLIATITLLNRRITIAGVLTARPSLIQTHTECEVLNRTGLLLPVISRPSRDKIALSNIAVWKYKILTLLADWCPEHQLIMLDDNIDLFLHCKQYTHPQINCVLFQHNLSPSPYRIFNWENVHSFNGFQNALVSY
jgi:hypothetical protein